MTLSKAFIAGLVCAGCVYAYGAVEGNNTAVVIQKAPVVSKTGFQLIGLPVRGFDITGQGRSKTLPLADVLPPASYPVGTTLQVVSNEVEGATEEAGQSQVLDSGVYTVSGTGKTAKWSQDGVETDFGTYGVANGSVLWLKTASDTPATTASTSFSIADMLAGNAPAAPAPSATEDAPLIFAGEKADKLFLVDSDVSGMVAFTNSTSESVALLPPKEGTTATTGKTQLVNDPQAHDQILRVVDGENDYIYYEYVAAYKDKAAYWKLRGVKESDFATRFTGNFDPYTIPPGEAFYYYRKP